MNPISFMKWYSFPRQFSSPSYPIEKYISINQVNSASNPSELSLLLSIDTSKCISLIVNGLYPLALFNFNAGNILSANFSNDLNCLYCVIQRDGCFFDTYNMSVLNKKNKQIQEIAEIYAVCEDFSKVLGRGIREVVKEAGSACNSFIGRYLNGIEDSLKKNGNNSSVEELLLQCAGTGVISPCLSKFIKEEMQNSKAITQYEEKLNLQVKNCQTVLMQDCKNVITGFLFYLTTLINFSKTPAYGPLGLDSVLLQELVESLSNLMHKIIETMGLLSNAHNDIKNIIH